MNYKQLFNSIWNTNIDKINYKVKIMYKNGLMFKYIPVKDKSI